MKFKKQKELIENLISSPDAFALCNAIIDYEYFDIELQPSVKFILDYYGKYGDIPSIKQIDAESDVELNTKEVADHEYQYTVDEVEKFCQDMAVQDAVMKAAQIITNKEDAQSIRDLIEDALQISVQKDLGLDYFQTVEERLERMQNEAELMPTCWPTFNDYMFGGLARKELVLFAANSGVGKSVALANLGMHYAEDGLNVLIITLELAEDLISQRFDTNITKISRRDWKDNIREIVSSVTNYKSDIRGNLQVKYMPTETKAVEVRTYLEQYKLHYGFYPDVICLDYLDKMTPNAKVNGNAFDVDKKISEQLRQIAVDYNLLMITASQLNRDAVGNADQNHSHIAGGISKINEADVVVSIFKTDGDVSDKLREVNFKFLKTRNSDGVDKMIDMNFNSNAIRFEEATERGKEREFERTLEASDRSKRDRITKGGVDNNIMSKLEQGNKTNEKSIYSELDKSNDDNESGDLSSFDFN